MLTHKEIKKKRILTYFIEAAQEIMINEGIENVTLRKVADMAGYNGATLYNYFKDFDQLILFASLKYLKIYNIEVSKQVKKCKNEREKFFAMWKVFCDVSFKYPQPFNQIFFNKHSDSLDVISKQYYELFPEDLGTKDKHLKEILLGTRLGIRNKISLKCFADEENLNWKNIDLMNEMIIGLYHDLLLRCINDNGEETKDYYHNKMMEYLDYIIKSAS